MRFPNATRSLITTLLSAVFLIFMFAGCDSAGSEEENGGPSFDSGPLQPGDTFSYTFQEEGNVPYYCENHQPDMTGEITVQSGAQSADPDTVVMNNLRFTPSSLTISPNTTVVWVNREDNSVDPHTVTSGQPPSNGGGY